MRDSTNVNTGQSVGSSVLGSLSGILGGGLGLLSPVVSGIMSLFGIGGSNSAPAQLPYYTPPPGVQMSDTLRTATPSAASTGSAAAGASSSGGSASSAAPQVTVNISAMDSQSIMDRSSDIASAVRQAMLNSHPINDVVANL